MINHLPLGGDLWGTGINIEGRPAPRPGEGAGAVYRVARPGYFQTMKIPILAGRDFTGRDREDAPGVVIVNEKLAKTFWPNGTAVGKRLRPDGNAQWLTVVGVIKNAKQDDWAAQPDNEYYLPFLQDKGFREGTHPWVSYMTLVIRTSGNPLNLSKAVQSAVWSIDKNLPLSHLETLERVISTSVWRQRFNVLLVGLFAMLALVLAAVGIYAVMAYSVTERTHEIGIRLALGAKQGDVLRLVVKEGMMLAAVGAAAGVAGAFLLTRVLTGLLYQVEATDPVIFASVPFIFAAVAFLASYIPAQRAARVDPMIALRCE